MSEAFRQDAETNESMSILERHGRKLLYAVASAGGAAAVMFGAGGDIAHADETVDPEAGTVVLNEAGDTIYDGLDQMLPKDLVLKDLAAHGVDTPEERAHLQWPIGKVWQMDSGTRQELERRRVEQAINATNTGKYQKPTESIQKPVSAKELDRLFKVLDLDPREDVWGELEEAGVAANDMDDALGWVEFTNPTIDYNKLPAGFQFTIPRVLLTVANDNTTTPPQSKPTPQAPEVVVPAPVPTPAPVEVPLTPVPTESAPQSEQAPKPAQPEAAPTSTVAPEAAPAPTAPEVKEPQIIEDVLKETREQYVSGRAEIAPMVAFIQKNFKHPEINPANGITAENVNQLYVLPDPQTGFDFIVNPQTCENQAITSAPMLAAMIVTQDYAHWLTETKPEFAHLKGKFRIQFGDMNDGQHDTHQNALAIDIRSSFIGDPGELHPDGPLFMSNTAGFDLAFNEAVMPFMIRLRIMGQPVIRQLITSSKRLEKDLTGRNHPGDWVARVGGHGDHEHVDLYDSYAVPGFVSPAQPLDCNHPATGGHTEYEQPAPVITSPPTTVDTTVPPETTVPETTVPVTTTPPETTTPTPETTQPSTEQEKLAAVEPFLSDAAKNYKVVDPMTAFVKSKNARMNGGNLSSEEAYGPQISPVDTYAYLRAEGGTESEALLFTAISMRESDSRPASVGDVKPSEKTGQILPSNGLYMIRHLDDSPERDPASNLNPVIASRNAIVIKRASGYGPWEVKEPATFTVETLYEAIRLPNRDFDPDMRAAVDKRCHRIAEELMALQGTFDQIDAALGA